MIRYISRLALAVVFAGLLAGPAWAQEAPSRPFRGLFGGNQRNLGASQTLDLVGQVQGGYDDDILAASDQPQILDPRYQVGGEYAASNVALSYATGSSGRAISFGARASTDVRYSPPALSGLSSPRHEGTVSLALAKTKGMLSVNAQQGASYAPYRRLTLFPRFPQLDAAPVTVPGYEFAVSTDRVYALSSNAGLGLRLGRRSSFNMGYSRVMSDYASHARELVDQSLGAGFTHRITTHASLRLGYSYRLGSYSGSGDAPVASRSYDAGIDYNRPLSISRKTSVTFGSGTTGASDGRRISYFATGSAGLNQEFGRSWGARLSVSRGLSFLDGFSTPFISDGVSAETTGYLGRRVDLGVTAGYAQASSVRIGDASRYNAYTGAARFRLALSRFGSFYVQYFYFQYHLRDFERTLQGVPLSMERRGLRAGLTWWLPLLR